jgi:Putative Zn-dependent protease, contains TPR repeats
MRKLFLLAIILLLFEAMPVNAQSLQELERKQVDEYLYKGNVCSIQKDFAKAIEYYSKAIAIKEKDAEIYLTRGKVYLIEKQYDLAMADFQKAIELSDDYKTSGYLALIPYSKEISLDDKNIDAYQKRAEIYRGMRKYDLALADYSKIIQLQPANKSVYQRRGAIYQHNLNIYDAALNDYNKAIDIDPANAYSYYLRGELYFSLQKLDLSIADYTKAIELYPQNYIYYYRRAIAYEKKKRYNLAVKDYTAAINLGDQNFKKMVYPDRGKAYLELKEYDLAIADFSKGIEKKENYTSDSTFMILSNLYSNRAQAYYKKNQYELAINDYSAAIELGDYDVSLYYKRGSIYAQLHMDDLARADYDKVLNNQIINYLGDNYALVNYYKAMIFEALGKKQDAIIHYHKYLQKRLTNYPDAAPITKYDFYRYMDEKETKSEIDERIKYAQERLKVLSGYKM